MGLGIAQERYIFVFVLQMLCLQQQKTDKTKKTCGRIDHKFFCSKIYNFVPTWREVMIKKLFPNWDEVERVK
jgi:hypothetical protein